MDCKIDYCSNCSAIYLIDSFPVNGFNEKYPNGTVTYISHNDRYFYVTCKHVVELCGEHTSLVVTQGDFYFNFLVADHSNKELTIGSKFHTPKKTFNFEYIKDIAVFEIPANQAVNFFRIINKEPISLPSVASCSVDWACAVGYPSNMKKERTDNGQRQVSSSCCRVQIEMASSSISREFTCSSDYELGDIDFSGMSGGPIFSVDNGDFIGMCIESQQLQQSSGNMVIRGQCVDDNDLLSQHASNDIINIISGYHYSTLRIQIPWFLFQLDYATEDFVSSLRE